MSATPKTDAFIAAARRRGVTVLEHDDWGAVRADVYRTRLDTRPHGLLPAKPVDTIWHHITVTFDTGRLPGEFKADLRKVEAIGWQRFGSGISYNILVDANATVPRIAVGQFLEAKGTHTVNDKGTAGFSYDQNKVSVAVAFVGMPGDQLSPAAVEAIVQVEAALIEVGACTTTYDCVPHSLVASKDCPTDALRDLLPEIRRRALAAATKPPVQFFPVRHRIVSTNLFVGNPAKDAVVSGPLAGVNRIIAKATAAFRLGPDVIACQESHPHLRKLVQVGGYDLLYSPTEDTAGRELAVLVRDGLKMLGTEYHHGADGVKGADPVLDHPRGIFVVKYVKRGQKTAVVNTHMGWFAESKAVDGHPGAAAEQHAEHATKVVRIANRLRSDGFHVFVTADANSHGRCDRSLPAQLVAAGWRVTRDGVDLVASDPSQTRPPDVQIVPHQVVGSDHHDAVCIRATERKPR